MKLEQKTSSATSRIH